MVGETGLWHVLMMMLMPVHHAVVMVQVMLVGMLVGMLISSHVARVRKGRLLKIVRCLQHTCSMRGR